MPPLPAVTPNNLRLFQLDLAPPSISSFDIELTAGNGTPPRVFSTATTLIYVFRPSIDSILGYPGITPATRPPSAGSPNRSRGPLHCWP